jgi:hypothetical protein
MGLIGRSLQSGFGREIGKNTGKVVSNAIFGHKHSTPLSHTIEKQEEAHNRKLEIEREKVELKLKLEQEKHLQKLELELVKQDGLQKQHKLSIEAEIAKYKKNVVGELKKLKELFDFGLLTQEEYNMLKSRLFKYL